MILARSAVKVKFRSSFKNELKKYIPNQFKSLEDYEKTYNLDIKKMDLLELHQHKTIVKNALAFLQLDVFFAFDRYGYAANREKWLLARLARINAKIEKIT